ncbi:hypothetical protein TSOC_000888 [Tetrabaena socialis]|uniref:Uncharacterized protein n=1 Tax=Tetrabaena socialis TaxID=47790 RepID=A0A2J8AI55_9CHLO|nr:hypothetical protein TSOC_000888 [Tetrabaena socialis]|eukprot:PNH12190.1 hypothetical protein TSOC_000888 [Tetrabaena socialis]
MPLVRVSPCPTREQQEGKASCGCCFGAPLRPPYFARKAVWKAASAATTSTMSSSEGRKVVRKWKVPSAWPKPLPGTTTMPVVPLSPPSFRFAEWGSFIIKLKGQSLIRPLGKGIISRRIQSAEEGLGDANTETGSSVGAGVRQVLPREKRLFWMALMGAAGHWILACGDTAAALRLIGYGSWGGRGRRLGGRQLAAARGPRGPTNAACTIASVSILGISPFRSPPAASPSGLGPTCIAVHPYQGGAPTSISQSMTAIEYMSCSGARGLALVQAHD